MAWERGGGRKCPIRMISTYKKPVHTSFLNYFFSFSKALQSLFLLFATESRKINTSIILNARFSLSVGLYRKIHER